MGIRAAAAVATLAALRLAIAAFAPLTPEEAYHWNYARHLDWSYYDHPPAIAWAIAAGRLVFGDTPLGVRFVPVLFSLGTTLLAARLSTRLFGAGTGRATAWLLALEPVLSLAGASAFPDSPLLFFWTLALSLVWRAIETGRGPFWIAAGAAMGAAMLSKYTAVFLGVSMLAFLLWRAEDRRWLRTPWPYLGAASALAVFSPVIAWNAAHDWASFRFQSVGRMEKADAFLPLGGLRYLAGQIGAFVPLLAPLLVVAVRDAARFRRREDRFLLASAAPLLLVFFLLSWSRSIHLMWPMPAYVGLTILMSRTWGSAGRVAEFYRRRQPWLVGVSAAGLAAAALHAAVFLPGISPFPGQYGWKEAAARARELRIPLGRDAFYLGVGRAYTCASQLAFHLREPSDVHGKNLLGGEGLQYDLWADPAALAGRDAVVVVVGGDRTPSTLAQLNQRFQDVEEAGRLVIPLGRRTLLRTPPLEFLFFVARGYRPELTRAEPPSGRAGPEARRETSSPAPARSGR